MYAYNVVADSQQILDFASFNINIKFININCITRYFLQRKYAFM